MLSILICTIPSRCGKLNVLLDNLNNQAALQDQLVEIITDDTVGISIGEKRNRLVNRAVKKYVSQIDDDDQVSPEYVFSILQATESNPDCVGICGKIWHRNEWWTFRHSITVGRWCRDKHNKIFFRTPNHLNPILRELCLAAPFPDTSYGEDREFSERVRPLLKTEAFIEDAIYYYTPSGERHW